MTLHSKYHDRMEFDLRQGRAIPSSGYCRRYRVLRIPGACRILELMRALIVVFSLLVAFGCSNTKTVDSLTPVPDQPRSIAQRRSSSAVAPTPSEDGRDLFVANCIQCHGRNADGDTPAGRNWHVPNLRSPQVQSLGDDALRQIIREGKGKMPAWGALLSQTDIDHLAAYVRTFKNP